MIRLTRGINLTINSKTGFIETGPTRQIIIPQPNMTLWVTLGGSPDRETGFVVNVATIKKVFQENLKKHPFAPENNMEILNWAKQIVHLNFPEFICLKTQLDINDSLSLALIEQEPQTMMQLTTKYELAAAHKLWNNDWDAKRNFEEFGKCSNPAGHGHNYLLEITLEGRPDAQTQQIISMAKLNKIVNEVIIEPFDHKNLSKDVPEFKNVIPTVENMTKIFWELLAHHFGSVRLARVAVWETPKTYAEYFGPTDGPLRYSENV